MKFSHSLLLVFFIGTISCAYILPDFGIDKEAPKCYQINKYIQDLVKDQSYVKEVYDSIPGSISLLDKTRNLVDEACSLTIDLKTKNQASLLQMNKIDKNDHKDGAFLQKNLDYIFGEPKEKKNTNMFDDYVNANISEATKQLTQIQSSTTEDLGKKCFEIENNLRGLREYLDWAQNEISNELLKTYFPKREEELKKYKIDCQTSVQTGIFSQKIDSSSPLLSKQNKERTVTYSIKFEESFRDTPQIALSLTGFDIDSDKPSIQVYHDNANPYGFDLLVTASEFSSIRAFQVHWLAAYRPSAGIVVSTAFIDYVKDADVQSKYEFIGPRSFTRSIRHSAAFFKADSVATIAGFGFDTSKYDPNLRVHTQNSQTSTVDVVFSVEDRAMLRSALAYVISFEKNSYKTGYSNVDPSSYTGIFTSKKEDSYSIPVPNVFSKDPITLPLVTSIAFSAENSLSLNTDVELQKPRYLLNVNVGKDSKLNKYHAEVLFVCPQKAEC